MCASHFADCIGSTLTKVQYWRVPNNKKSCQRDLESDDEVLNSLQTHPSMSISAELNLPKTKMAKVLYFLNWIAYYRLALFRTIFSDEAQFTKEGMFNIYNSHICFENSPHSIRERNSQWCAVMKKIIWYYFSKVTWRMLSIPWFLRTICLVCYKTSISGGYISNMTVLDLILEHKWGITPTVHIQIDGLTEVDLFNDLLDL